TPGAEGAKAPRPGRARTHVGPVRSGGPVGHRRAGAKDDLLDRERQAACRVGPAAYRGDDRRLRSKSVGPAHAEDGSECGLEPTAWEPVNAPDERQSHPAACRTK